MSSQWIIDFRSGAYVPTPVWDVHPTTDYIVGMVYGRVQGVSGPYRVLRSAHEVYTSLADAEKAASVLNHTNHPRMSL